MCGRVNVGYREQFNQALSDWTNYRNELTLEGQFNAAPTSTIPAIIDSRAIDTTWGINQHYSGRNVLLSNMRAEKMHSGFPHKILMRRSRCIILINGFYEWKRTPDGKQPFYISGTQSDVLALGGVFREEDDQVHSSIITTAANGMMSSIHDRMPVLLSANTLATWLSSDSDEELRALMEPDDEAPLKAVPVSSYVNSSRNQGEQCLTALEAH